MIRSLSRNFATVAGALAAAAVLAGCGAATAPSSSPSTATTGSGFDPSLVSVTKSGTTPAVTSTKPYSAGAKTTIADNEHPAAAKKVSIKKVTNLPDAVPSAAATPKPVVTTTASTVTPAPASSTPSVVTVTVAAPTPAPTTTPSGNPTGPWPASLLPEQSYKAFTIDGGNIGCEIGDGSARCDIASRTWSPTPEPKSCELAWGQGLTVGSTGSAHFVCAGDTALDPNGPAIANGYDDVVDGVTCQIRTVGVICFAADRRGFWISRKAYSVF